MSLHEMSVMWSLGHLSNRGHIITLGKKLQ